MEGVWVGGVEEALAVTYDENPKSWYDDSVEVVFDNTASAIGFHVRHQSRRRSPDLYLSALHKSISTPKINRM